MKAIAYSDVIALKKAVQERFSKNVHFHDYCSSYAFTLEEPDAELQAFISEYFAQKQQHAAFAADGVTFTLD